MTGRYQDTAAPRHTIEARLARDASDSDADLAQRRRPVVFCRIAARLSSDPAGRCLKGAAAHESRLRDRARTTRDTDLAPAPGAKSLLPAATVRNCSLKRRALSARSGRRLWKRPTP
jgi:hypothetical protein